MPPSPHDPEDAPPGARKTEATMSNVVQFERAPSAALAPLDFTAEQRAMIRDMYAKGASELEFTVMMEIARVRRLNPILKQIYFVSRFDDFANQWV